MDKILFNIYLNYTDQVMKKLDFPKGKVNQNENPIQCAIREIIEEIDLDVSLKIKSDQYIKM